MMELMSGYLIFALVATLELISPGTTRYGVDVISGGVLDSHYSVTVDGSVSRFVKTAVASESGLYLQVERSAAFGHVYTAVPGPALSADTAGTASAPAQLPPVAFSLAGMLNKLRSPAQATEQRITIEDPVAALTDALSVAAGSPAGDAAATSSVAMGGAKPAGAAQPSNGGAPAAGGSGPKSGAAAGLAVSVYSRNNLTYLELTDQSLVLVVHQLQ